MINFEALRKARERVDDSRDGKFGRCGNWKMALGGYDMGYEVYYKEEPVMRVNYELEKYEFYDCDYADAMFTQDTIPQIKKALEITPRFDNVGDIDDNGDYIDRFGQHVNDVEANVSESRSSRLPVMWAIDFRDFHTAIHGLIYGKNRRDVEKFYDRLNAIFADDIPQEEQEIAYQDLWDEFYPRIQMIDEINFRDIGKLPSGKYGIIIDDVEYRLVNNVSIDIYEESGKTVKSKKIVKEGTIPEMEDADYGVAGEICSELLNYIGVSDGAPVLDVVANAIKIDPHGTEVNGDLVEDVTDDGLIHTFGSSKHKHYLLPEDVEWLRVEHYAKETKTPGPCIMYVYIHKKPNSDAFDMDNVQFDYYPDPETDDYVDGVQYRDCVRHMGVSESTSRQNESEDEKAALLDKLIGLCDKSSGLCIDLTEIKDKYFECGGLVKESAEGDDNNPKVYVSTYAKYNKGGLDGKWVDLTDFNTYDEFMEYIRDLHKDEKDPEFMFQDFENFPRRWYSEGGLDEETFDKIMEFYELSDAEKAAYEVYVNLDIGDDDIESFREKFEGEFSSPEDFAYHIVEEYGIGDEWAETYFDYDAFGRDMMMDYHMGDPSQEDADGNPEDEDHYYDMDNYDMGEYESDAKVAEDFVDDLGGVSKLGAETIDRYFDYDAFGRDLLINDYIEDDGYIFNRY